MRVAVVSKLLPAGGTTSSHPLWRTTRVLRERCDTVAIGPVPWAPPIIPVSRWKAFRALPAIEDVLGLEVRHPRFVVVPGRLRWVQGWSYRHQLARELRRVAGEFRPDVLFVTWTYPDLYAAVDVGASLGIPVVGQIVGNDVNSLPRIGLGAAVTYALRRADRVVGNCAALADRALGLGVPRERCRVIKNGLDLTIFAPRERATCRQELGVGNEVELLLYVGRLTHVKGVDLLLDVFRLVAAVRPLARLVVIGGGEMHAALADEVTRVGLAHRVQFLGGQSQAVIAKWMSASNLLVLASRYEGLPNVILESLACGTPVVASRVGGVADAVTSADAGEVVEPGDSAAFADAVVRTLERGVPQDRVRASVSVRRWEDVGDDFISLFAEVIEERRASRGAGR